MSICLINFRYLFNKTLYLTIKQQIIKYHIEGLGKNRILLNHYNIIIDTILSIVSIMDMIITKLKNKYEKVYIFETDEELATDIPAGYKYGYYVPEFKRSIYIKDIPKQLMYPTKLLHDYIIKTKNNLHKKISYIVSNDKDDKKIIQIDKWKKKARTTNRIFMTNTEHDRKLHKSLELALTEIDRLDGNELDIDEYCLKFFCPKSLITKKRMLNRIKETIEYYANYYKKNYAEQWEDYDTTLTIRNYKIYPIIRNFNLHLHRYQSVLLDEEINDIYKYIVSCSKLEEFKTIDENINKIAIISNAKINLQTNNNIKITYCKINKEMNIVNAGTIKRNVNKTEFKTYSNENDVLRLLRGIKQMTLIDIINKVSSYELFENVIDIDPRYGINLFVDCYEIGLYSHLFSKSIIDDGYKKDPLSKNINFVSPMEYINFMSKILTMYNKFDNFYLS